jgi:hypothetical protein
VLAWRGVAYASASRSEHMGSWAVIAQYHDFSRDHFRAKVIGHARETKDEALEELRAVLHTYSPRSGIVEQWRQVYRFADRESYLLVIKGLTTRWECTLRVAELVSDSADPEMYPSG